MTVYYSSVGGAGTLHSPLALEPHRSPGFATFREVSFDRCVSYQSSVYLWGLQSAGPMHSSTASVFSLRQKLLPQAPLSMVD